jgi:hypothetical protein
MAQPLLVERGTTLAKLLRSGHAVRANRNFEFFNHGAISRLQQR